MKTSISKLKVAGPLGSHQLVTEAGHFTNMSASAQVYGAQGTLTGIFVASASATPTIKVWDNTAGSGTVLVNTFTPSGATFYPMPAGFNTGLFVTISGTVDCTVFWAPAQG